MYIFIFLLIAFVPDWAYAFNPIWLMDPDFLEYTVLRIPLTATLFMGLWESIATMKLLKPRKTPALFYMMQYFFACLMGILLSILIISILFFIVGEVLHDSDEPVVVWGGIGYFMLMFVYLGWDQRRKDIEKMWGDEAKYVPVKQVTFITTSISYGIMYGFYYVELF